VEIEVRKVPILNQYDDGARHIECEISIAENIPPRRQRQAVIYETLASLLGYTIPHQQLEDITEMLGEALDQLD